MATTIYHQYLEAEVLSAHPLKLVAILYRGALEALRGARRNLAAGDIRARSRQVMKTWEILQELSRMLDHSAGDPLSGSLAELYAYMQRRLLEANARQIDAPLAEVQHLLSTLNAAWQGVGQEPAPVAGLQPRESLSCDSC